MTLRWRQPGESVKEWLLPHHHRGNEGRFGLEREVAQPFLAPGIELEEGEEFHGKCACVQLDLQLRKKDEFPSHRQKD